MRENVGGDEGRKEGRVIGSKRRGRGVWVRAWVGEMVCLEG